MQDVSEANGAREEAGDGLPVCSRCFTPFEPFQNSCAECGAVVGQHTEYVPFVNVPWLAGGYDRLRRSTWPQSSSVFVQVVGALATIALAPLLLVVMFCKWVARSGKARSP